MNKVLNDLQKLVTELNTTNSTNKKKDILVKYPECKDILFYVYHPFKKYHVTSKNLKKLKNLDCDYTEFDDIFQMLDLLNMTWISGHHAIKSVNMFVEENKEYEELIYKIIDRNLKCRANTSLINDVFPDLIPEFDVALAYSYKDHKKKVDFEEDWYVSIKMNGVRCVIFKEGDKVTYLSRAGKEFFTLDKLTPYILEIDKENVVLDGELCILDEDGKENFISIVSEVKRKNHTIEAPKFFAFDILEIEDFNRKKSKETLSERQKELYKYVKESDKINILEQIKINDMEHFEEFQNRSAENGWEGLILRKNVPYEGKRSNNLLKFKLFQEAEFIVKDIEVGPIRHIVYDDEGISSEIESIMMTKAVIEYKGYDVGVGSGWSMEQRMEFYNDPNKIIGKQITARYFLPSKNKKGGESLQHPTVKVIWEAERDI